jgi:hypothetical protein
MRYIREYNDISYYEVSQSEVSSVLRDDLVDVDDIIRRISVLFKYVRIGSYGKLLGWDKSYISIYSEKGSWFGPIISGKREFIRIICCKDEWFYVSLKGVFNMYNYKCDQLDGLLDCLSMLKDKYNLV